MRVAKVMPQEHQYSLSVCDCCNNYIAPLQYANVVHLNCKLKSPLLIEPNTFQLNLKNTNKDRPQPKHSFATGRRHIHNTLATLCIMLKGRSSGNGNWVYHIQRSLLLLFGFWFISRRVLLKRWVVHLICRKCVIPFYNDALTSDFKQEN